MLNQNEQIARLEADVDELTEAAERCRKISMAAKAAVATGLPLLGSNQRTWDDTLADIRLREAQRAELIDGLGLESVVDRER